MSCYNLLYCCGPTPEAPGFMDLYCTTTVTGRLSTGRVFTRTCALNTLQLADNGAALEPSWSAERQTGVTERFREKQRIILASNASWNGTDVYQSERYQPVFYDDPGFSGTFGTLSAHTPLVDPTGDGWTVHSNTTAEQLATFNMGWSLGAEVTGSVNITLFSFTAVGAVFWYESPDDPYFRVVVERASKKISIQWVSGSAVSTLASGTVAPSLFGGQMTIALTLTPSTGQIVAKVNGVNSGGTSYSLQLTAQQSPGSPPPARHGIYATGDGSQYRFRLMRFEARKGKHYVSVYSTTAPSVVAEHLSDAFPIGHVGYAGGLLASGAKGLWTPTYEFLPGDGSLISGDPPPPLPFVPAPVHEFDGAVRTIHQGLTHPLIKIPDLQNTNPGAYATAQGLGYDAVASVAKHGYPMAAGYKIRETSVIGQTSPGSHNWDTRAVHAVVLGPLVFPPGTAPYVVESQEVVRWETVRQVRASPETPPSEELIRVTHSALLTAIFLSAQAHVGWRGDNIIRFQALPDLAAWSLTISNAPGPRRFIGGQGWQLELPTSVSGQQIGYSIEVADSEGGPRVAVSSSEGQRSFRIYGAGGGIVYERLGIFPGLKCASDRFFYASLGFGTAAARRAFSTATLPDAVANLQLNEWMISHDGSIRFPVVAVTKDAVQAYGLRSQLENAIIPGHGAHLYKGGDVDCIKSSELPRSPALANPTY